MCLETFGRNRRWHPLFPHTLPNDPRKKLSCALCYYAATTKLGLDARSRQRCTISASAGGL